MPPDTTHSSRRSRPWYATDSGRAGLVLSAVTIAVLAIGVAVIQSARSSDTVDPTSASRQDAEQVIPPAPQPNEEEVIVVTGSASTPTPLPATTPEGTPTQFPSPRYETEGASLPFTAERPEERVYERR
jgi:hypothetical protein